jgi:hypothetical protein
VALRAPNAGHGLWRPVRPSLSYPGLRRGSAHQGWDLACRITAFGALPIARRSTGRASARLRLEREDLAGAVGSAPAPDSMKNHPHGAR